ncbi:conserved hypothetical protein [Hyphomicrobiales bacterium]|nr:conserved hypothetical protein [Hyphomicrobiales bacterium]CAH1700702.1 conserved hypothetical protein [Hyphomicrobiales bacterium]CAI0344551.1 conserved hypothetical protein [Hyphomicrobiales bacterium]
MAEDHSEPPEIVPAAQKPKRPAVSRKAVVGQLWRAAKRQLDAHEDHLADLPKGSTASEADAKALATLARTVRELVAIEEPQAGKRDKQTDELSAADGLRHVAQLRQELARRLEALAAEEAGEGAQEAGGDGAA